MTRFLFIALLMFGPHGVEEPRRLAAGDRIEGALARSGSDAFEVALEAGHLLRLSVEQRGVDAVVAVEGADGALLVEVDDVPAISGSESLAFVAPSSASYTVRVRAATGSPDGAYLVTVDGFMSATPRDRVEAEATALAHTALAAAAKGDGPSALPAAERALALRAERFGLASIEAARAHYAIAMAAEAAADVAKAEASYRLALETGERFARDLPEIARPLSSLAILAYGRSDLSAAVALGERSLVVAETACGPAHTSVADALTNLAAIYLAGAEYDKAEARQKRAIEIYERALGPDDPALANAVNTLAVLYESRERLDEAEPLHARALAIREKALGPDHPQVANSLFNLGISAKTRGDYARARTLHERALAIREKAYGPDHPEVAASVDALATLARLEADYPRAEALYARALASAERAYGSEHPRVGMVHANRAALGLVRGDYEAAERDFLRALALLEKGVGPDHPFVSTLVMNYGIMLRYAGRTEEAVAKLERAAKNLEAKLGPESPTLAQSLDELGVAVVQSDPARASSLFERSLAIREKVVGPDSYEVAASLASKGSLERRRGDLAGARATYERMLAIVERLFGDAHPDTGRAYGYLSDVAWAAGDLRRAVEMRVRSDDALERDLARNLSSGTERQKVLYLDLWARELGQSLSLHLTAAPTDRAAARMALGAILRRKGRALDAMSRTMETLRNRGGDEDRALLDRLAEVRARLSAATLAGPGTRTPEAYRRDLDELQRLADELEARAGARFTELRAASIPVTLDAVLGEIPDDAVLIEIASYFPYDPKTTDLGARRYAAYVVGRDGEVAGVDLGDAEKIDALATSLRDALRSRRNDRALARRLDEQVFRPVRRLAAARGQAARHLLVSPDGALNLVPFAALVDERGRRLVESYTVTYLTSGRDLLRLSVKRAGSGPPLVVAAPDFGGPPASGRVRSVRLRPGASAPISPEGLLQLYFPALPGTAAEARSVARTLPDARLLTGARATKKALLEARGPVVLHVATHGFFLGSGGRGSEIGAAPSVSASIGARAVDTAPAPDPQSPAPDPLILSGLALAGANEEDSADGVLTALEVAGLDLWGTRLAVLSACDTGVGEVRAGEGVYGLRRALVLAGSESQLMSLWPVSDDATRRLMTDYYRAIEASRGRSEALRDVQLRMLRDPRRRAPYYWASFIQSGDWRPLDDAR